MQNFISASPPLLPIFLPSTLSMARARLILAILLVAVMASHNLQPAEGRRLSFRTPNNLMDNRIKNVHVDHGNSNGDNRSTETNPMQFVVPAAVEATPPDPSVMLPCPPPPPPPQATVRGAPGHADNFRPTAPGHSPGIGNSVQN